MHLFCDYGGDFVLRDFRFASGETLPELKLHYFTIGTPARNAEGRITNAVLLLHGTNGRGTGFLTDGFAGELFGSGQPLDASRWFIIVPDSIGHGRSGKPSDELRAKFPRYVYADMVEAQHRLVTEGLGLTHLRLVMGTSMGAMHAWMWGYMYPAFADGLVPLYTSFGALYGRLVNHGARVAFRTYPKVDHVAIVIDGMSDKKLFSRICLASSGRNGTNKVASAMLIMLPKLALVVIATYLSVLAKARRPSITPWVRTSRSRSNAFGLTSHPLPEPELALKVLSRYVAQTSIEKAEPAGGV